MGKQHHQRKDLGILASALFWAGGAAIAAGRLSDSWVILWAGAGLLTLSLVVLIVYVSGRRKNEENEP